MMRFTILEVALSAVGLTGNRLTPTKKSVSFLQDTCKKVS